MAETPRPIHELLARRETRGSEYVLSMLAEGLDRKASASGPSDEARQAHQLLLDYDRMSDKVIQSSHATGFKRFPKVAQKLLALCREADEDKVADLLESVMQGKPRPHGGFRAGLLEGAGKSREDGHPGTSAALDAMAHFAGSNKGIEADLELSLVWDGVADLLLDHIEPYANQLAFDWGPSERAIRQRRQAVTDALASHSAVDLLNAFFTDPAPHVLCCDGDDMDDDADSAPDDAVPVPVVHVRHDTPLQPATLRQLAPYSAAAQLLALYQRFNGGALCCVDTKDMETAGFILLPDTEWDAARERMLRWLTMVDYQDDPQALPGWVRTASPFGMIPGDASRWLLPLEGPFAGKVLLSKRMYRPKTTVTKTSTNSSPPCG